MRSSGIEGEEGGNKTVELQADPHPYVHITEQQPFDCCGAYGSSRLSTWTLVGQQRRIKVIQRISGDSLSPTSMEP